MNHEPSYITLEDVIYSFVYGIFFVLGIVVFFFLVGCLGIFPGGLIGL